MRVLAIIAVLCSSTLLAQESTPAFSPVLNDIDLQDGETLVFLGDSITHQCLYTQYVEDYFFTRYPDRRIHFHNAGVGGDRADDALIRFDQDVAQFKPAYVTILLGMNDGSYTNFQQAIFDRYETDMTTLLERVAAIGAKAIVMTPTMFDSRAAQIRDRGNSSNALRNEYYNPVLAFYGMWLQEQAFERGLGFVDMHSPLNDLTVEQRKGDPTFTMIADAVHPGPAGQLVMALAILEDMHADREVSSITGLQNANGNWKFQATGGEVSQVQASADHLRFSFKAEALPWVVPEAAAEGVRLAKANSKMNRETLRLFGLTPGKKFTLKIDGQVVGEYWPQRLADGIQLQGNTATPQYQQALQVAQLNQQRNEQAYRSIRNLWSKRKQMRRAVERAESEADKATKQQELDTWLSEFDQELARLLELAKSLEDQIYEANQPRAHAYELSR